MDKVEGRADCVTQEQCSVDGRAELKAKTGKPCFLHYYIFLYLILHESTFFFWNTVIENPSGLCPSGVCVCVGGGGLRP